MKSLVLAEKPSVAREIARVLGANRKINGAMQGDKYIVTWALGHLVTLAMPEELDEKWRLWQEETLPMVPEHFETRVIQQTARQYNIVKSLLNDNDVNEIIIATDAGREGELVARWIIEKAGVKKHMKRLWISSLTDKAIKDGFNHLLPASQFDSLYNAALGRAQADWLVGLNVTRALTCKYSSSLSAGRVQTPTLGLIVKREEEINEFVSKKYYMLQYETKNMVFNLYDKETIVHFSSLEEATSFKNRLDQGKIRVKEIKEKIKREPPNLLYDLTSLQEDANRLYGFSAKKTLDIIQNLYENQKYLTYPRTDSKYLSTDMYDTIKDRLINGSYGDFKKRVNEVLSKPLKNSKRIFNNELVTDHHAIIPTEQRVIFDSLSDDEGKIYNLVFKRFLGAFMDDYEYTVKSVYLTCQNKECYFLAQMTQDIKLGFNVLNVTGNKQQSNFTIGETLSGGKLVIKEGKTLPPERYTEATLLDAMENAGRYVSSQQEKAILKEASGIGTPATRAEIIERIFDAGYVKLSGRSIQPTSKGIQLISLVPEEMKSPSLTASQEYNLTLISKREKYLKDFIIDITAFTKELTAKVLASKNIYKHDNVTNSTCPNCGKKLLDMTNKYGKSLVCIDKNCGYKKVIYKISNFHCPTCHKLLKLLTGLNGNVFSCDCGYKVKQETFFANLKNSKAQMGKRETQKYLKKQNDEIPSNNPFKDLLS